MIKTASDTKIKTLLTHPLFDSVDTPHIDTLLHDIAVLELTKKDHLLYCGNPLTHYYYLLSGVIQLYRPTPEGDEKVFYIVKDNELFFATTPFSRHPIAPFSVMTLRSSIVLQLSSAYLVKACRACPQLSINLLKQFSAQYHQAINRIDILTINNASQRFVIYLFDLADTYDNLTLDLPLTQKSLARQLNITPETLSRIIHSLCATEFLDYAHNTFRIVKPKQLRAYVNLPAVDCSCQNQYASFSI